MYFCLGELVGKSPDEQNFFKRRNPGRPFKKKRNFKNGIKVASSVDPFPKSISCPTAAAASSTITTSTGTIEPDPDGVHKCIDLASEPTRSEITGEEEGDTFSKNNAIDTGKNSSDSDVPLASSINGANSSNIHVKSTYSFSSDSDVPFTISSSTNTKSEVAKLIEKKINDSVNLAKAQGNGKARVNFIPCRNLLHWAIPLQKKKTPVHEEVTAAAPPSCNKKDQELLSNVSTDSENRDQHWVTDDESSIRTNNASPTPTNGAVSPMPANFSNSPTRTRLNEPPITTTNIPFYDQIEVKEEVLSPIVANDDNQFTHEEKPKSNNIESSSETITTKIDEEKNSDELPLKNLIRRSLSEGDVDDVIIINAASSKTSKNTKNRLKTKSLSNLENKTLRTTKSPTYTSFKVKTEPVESFDPRSKITFYVNNNDTTTPGNNSSAEQPLKLKRKRKRIEDDTKNTFIESWLKKERTAYANPTFLNDENGGGDDSDDFITSSGKIRCITASPRKNTKMSTKKMGKRGDSDDDDDDDDNIILSNYKKKRKKDFLRVKLRDVDNISSVKKNN